MPSGMAGAGEDAVAQRYELCHGEAAREGFEQLQPRQERHALQVGPILRMEAV